MKITHSPASPYVRKCLALAIKRGVDSQIEMWKIGAASPEVAALNPLSKIPTFVTDDGQALYDSPVVCEYIDSLGDAPPTIPPAGPARWKALTLAALGDGILDATQPRRREAALPLDDGRKEYIAIQQGKVARALDALEKETLGDLETIGEITVACALGYLDFRYPHEPWRPGHPKLTAWYERVVALPPMARTMPPAG
ncbi:glutathione S-transferase [Roseomonas terrae]|jgi:glutathione S-transferase|uniref:Glutathione S-transferase n=1 Tax=Neoroseomonas terrae TaxID=424799 RepID=A0ABS5EPH7_9PROT|nr:glutathione S-transferase C-terminal domain-containing protein [Neoroseomonas terrae]MBR0652897.1 glutathione S-transferase [Neoroseomonas terrae]